MEKKKEEKKYKSLTNVGEILSGIKKMGNHGKGKSKNKFCCTSTTLFCFLLPSSSGTLDLANFSRLFFSHAGFFLIPGWQTGRHLGWLLLLLLLLPFTHLDSPRFARGRKILIFHARIREKTAPGHENSIESFSPSFPPPGFRGLSLPLLAASLKQGDI